MELTQGLGLAYGGGQIQASLLQSSFSAKGFCSSLQQGYCYPNCSLDRVSSIRKSILRSRYSGFKNAHSRKGHVRCSESSITDTNSQVGIEVVESLEEAENQSLRAVSGDKSRSEGEFEPFAEKDDHVSPVQAALEEILSEEESAENTQFHSMEPEAVMAAATKVADALSEEEVTILSYPLLEPISPMGAAVVTVWPESLGLTEEDAVEESQPEEVGFMVTTEEPDYFAPPPEAATVVEETPTEEDSVEDAVTEEEPLLEPGAVASALMVKEVADALKTPDEDTVSHMLEKETEVERLQGVEEKSMIEQLRGIFVFAGPALGIWLSGPIMGIIDTAVIGQSSSLELAALGK